MQAFVYGNSKINPFLDAHSARKTINLMLEYNGRQERVNKPYKTFHEAGNRTNNRVDIVDIETFVDPTSSQRWIAWLNKPRHLAGTINVEDVRGIRLRANNIQIGDYNTFSRIFEKVRKTHSRFNGWFSGEVHILDPSIIPNSRRDFFEDNDAWREAERTLIEWAKDLAKRAYQNSSDRNRPVELIEGDSDEFIEEFERETAQGFTSESEREQALQDITDREQQIDKAISPNRTDEENEALRRKKEEVARLRQNAARPRSLIDESELSRHERKVLRFVMNIVYRICGAESAKLVAEEINKKLKEKARKRNASAPQGAREDNAQETASPAD
jgi:molecular chaperone HtpG